LSSFSIVAPLHKSFISCWQLCHCPRNQLVEAGPSTHQRLDLRCRRLRCVALEVERLDELALGCCGADDNVRPLEVEPALHPIDHDCECDAIPRVLVATTEV